MTITEKTSSKYLSRNGGSPHWETAGGLAGIKRWQEEWNDLAHAGSLSPVADAGWMKAFWRAFGRSDADLTVHALFEANRLLAVLPLQRRGRCWRCWSSVSNAHTPYSMFAIDEERDDLGDLILDHLLALSEVISFERFHQNGLVFRMMTEAAHRRRLRNVVQEHGGDALLKLPGSWEALRGSFSKKLRKNTERAERQLLKAGALSFTTATTATELDTVLRDCFELETRGWKGTTGSPILSQEDTLAFYTELARGAAEREHLALYMLRLNSELIAFEYCIRAHGKIDLLKLSYHPDWARYSPNNVLRFRILRSECERRLIHSYHMGSPSQWKLRWATCVEPLVRVRIYGHGIRSSVGYCLGPKLRSSLKRVRSLRGAVAYARKSGWVS